MRAIASAIVIFAGAYLWGAGAHVVAVAGLGQAPGPWVGAWVTPTDVGSITVGGGMLVLLVGIAGYAVALFTDRQGPRGPWPDARG